MPRISGAHRGEGVQAVVFALQILEYLAQHRSTLGVTDLARVFDTTKSRMHRHLQTLVAAGYVIYGSLITAVLFQELETLVIPWKSN